MIIIGILASIAIPTFLAQRNNAQESTMESDLRNWAAAATACYADNDGSYDNCDKATLAATPYNAVESENVTVNVSNTSGDVWTADASYTGLAATASYTTDPSNPDSGQVVVTP